MQPSAASANPLQRWVNGAPFWLGAGVAAYFLMPFEPPLALAWGLILFLPLLWMARHHLRGLALVMALLAIALGFCAGIGQTARVRAPVLAKPLAAVPVEGRVRDIVIDGKRQKLTLDEVVIDDLPAARTPERIRVSASLGAQEIGIGQRIAARATLDAPSRPVLPGGFDFGRYFYFRQIGGIGYVLPPVTVIPAPRTDSPARAVQEWMTRQRLALTRFLMAALPEPANALAVAYVTGDQSAVSETLQQEMRAAGLSHILAISGMHMTIVCGIVYFMVRLLLALLPWAALRYDIRKPAALLALLSGGMYLWLADFPISAVRAYVMIAIFFTAILAGREADGLRSLALAAIFILLVQPSSLLEPGFQLSFAAVLALILYYRWWSARRERDSWERAGWRRRAFEYFSGIMLSSIVAGAATAPIAAYHFHQFSSYGLLANTVCIPLVSFIVTPTLMLALALAPFGMESPFLEIVNEGFEVMAWVAASAAELPGAMLTVPPLTSTGVAVMILGGFLLLLHGQRWKFAGGALVLAGLSSALLYTPPDMLISADARAIALRSGDTWQLLKGTPRNFAVKEWQMALGQELSPGLIDRCDRGGCVHHAGRTLLAFPRYERALAEDCEMADLVITAKPLRLPCRAQLMEGRTLRRYGTHAVHFEKGKMTITHGCTGIAPRPWNRCPAQSAWERK